VLVDQQGFRHRPHLSPWQLSQLQQQQRLRHDVKLATVGLVSPPYQCFFVDDDDENENGLLRK